MAALKFCNATDVLQMPDDFPTSSPKAKKAWVDALCRQIVDMCWCGPLKSDVQEASRAYQQHKRGKSRPMYAYCICGGQRTALMNFNSV